MCSFYLSVSFLRSIQKPSDPYLLENVSKCFKSWQLFVYPACADRRIFTIGQVVSDKASLTPRWVDQPVWAHPFCFLLRMRGFTGRKRREVAVCVTSEKTLDSRRAKQPGPRCEGKKGLWHDADISTLRRKREQRDAQRIGERGSLNGGTEVH